MKKVLFVLMMAVMFMVASCGTTATTQVEETVCDSTQIEMPVMEEVSEDVEVSEEII